MHEVLNFLKKDGKMFKYYKRLDDVLMFKKAFFAVKNDSMSARNSYIR